jgi:hypothetical protein
MVLALGCGSSDTKAPTWPDPVPVNGIVTLNEQPLSDAMVTFSPIDRTVGKGASSITDSSGKYTLESPWVDGKTKPGAIPGNYKVTISRMVKPDGSVWKHDPNVGPMSMAAREELPDEYSFNSTLTAEVSKANAAIDFKLNKAK